MLFISILYFSFGELERSYGNWFVQIVYQLRTSSITGEKTSSFSSRRAAENTALPYTGRNFIFKDRSYFIGYNIIPSVKIGEAPFSEWGKKTIAC